jgi:hypothetical protein
MHCLIFCWNIVDIKKIFGDSFFYEVIVYLHLFHLGMKIGLKATNFTPILSTHTFARGGLCRSGFTTLLQMLLQEQSTVVLLWGRTLASWSLAIDERGGHEDLCGSGHWSVIPYVHGRTEFYCSSLPCLSLFFFLTP